MGTTAFADPGGGLAFVYVTTRIVLGAPGADPRAGNPIRAVYDAPG